MAKIKILYISHSPYLNGAEKCLLLLVKHLDKNLFEPVVILPSEGPLKEKIDSLQIKTYVLPIEWWVENEGRILFSDDDIFTRVQKVIEIINKEKPQIVHTNTSVVWDGALAAKITGIKHIWHIHEIFRGHPSLKAVLPLSLMYKAMDLLSEKVVVVSNAVKEELSDFIPPKILRTIYNGIDTDKFTRISDRSFRDEMHFTDDDVVATTITSLLKYKGIDNLIEAAAKVKEKGNVKFVIAGKGSDQAVAELQKKIKDMHLNDCINYIGYREDVPRILAGSDISILPSVKEAFPLVVLEAMASGKPVVATDCSGPSEMIVNGESGFIVPVNDPHSLAEKILEVAADREKMKAMGEKALSTFRKNFKAEVYAGHFEHLYRKIVVMKKSAGLSEKEKVLFDAFLQGYQNYATNIKALEERGRQLAERGEMVIRRDQLIAERNQWIADRDRQLAEHKQWLADRERDIHARDEWLADRDKQIAQRDQWLKDRVRDIHARDQWLAERDRKIAERDQWVADRDQQIARQAKWLEERKKDIDDRDKRLADLDRQVAERDQRLSEQSKDIRDRDNQLAERGQWVADRDQQIARQTKWLEERKKDIDDRDQLLAERDRKIAERDQWLSERAKDIRDRDSQLAERDGQLVERDQMLADRDREIAERDQWIMERDAKMNEFLNTYSWKITAPLRWLFALFTAFTSKKK